MPVPEDSSAHLWTTLEQEIHAMADREPALTRYLLRFVLPQMQPHSALALLLADRLAGPDMPQDHISAILIESLLSQPDIAYAAARDLMAIQANDPASRSHAHAFLNYKGFHAVQVARIAHVFWRTGRRDLAMWLSNRASVALGPDIHPAAKLGAGILLDHGSGIVIGETAVVGDDVTIMQNVTLGGTGKVRGDRHPKVRTGVVIGAGANIIGNIELGAFSKIAAGSVVLKDVPPHCTVAGIPAQIVRLHQHTESASTNSSPMRVC